MNIINDLKARIEARMEETKSPCKMYSTEDKAEKATAKMAADAGCYFTADRSNGYKEAQYVVFEVENLGWVGAINLTELMSRKTSTGGYLGFCVGFYTF